MELSAFRAPRPVPPKLQAGDKRIHMILRDLEKIKNTKPKKQLKRCNHLIYYIANNLRKAEDDHLLHSTAIWVLINIFRLFPEGTKPVMLESGIPGILYGIIKQGTLSGTSRQYASELCFYLSSNHPYPTGKELPAHGGPIRDFPELQGINRYQGELDDVSIASDLSSVMNESPSRTRQPFVPYRINDTNLAKMEAMFDEGYSGQLAASLPNHMLLSQFGFSQAKRRRGEEERPKKMRNDITEEQSSSSDASSDSEGEDDEEEGNGGSGAFGGRTTGLLGSTDVRKLTGKDDDDDDSSVLSTLSSGSKSQAGSERGGGTHWKFGSTNKKQKSSTFLALNDAPGRSLVQDDSWSQGSGRSFRQRKQLPGSGMMSMAGTQRPNTTTFATAALNQSSNMQSPSHFRLGGLQQPSQYADQNDLEGIQSFAFKSNSQDFARLQNGISSAPHRMVQQLRQDPQLSQTAMQYNFDKSKLDKAYKAWTSPSRGSRPQTTTAMGGLAVYTGHHSFADDRSVSSVNSTGNKAKPPRFSDSFLSAQASQSMMEPFSSTFQSPERRPVTSSDSMDINAFLSDLDPLSLNIKAVINDSLDPKQIAEDIDRDVDDDGEDWGSDDEDNEAYGLKDARLMEQDLENESQDPHAHNPYVQQRRLRLRAEKLIDHNFIKKLFIKNSKMDESQNLIFRMEQLLQLLDTEKTGYVSFEKFTRLIMAVAPKHVLRADVVNFMQAQTDSMDDLVDYTEFIISGKVLILTKAQYQQSLLAKELAAEKGKQRSKLTDPPGASNSKAVKDAFAHRTDAPDSAVWLKRQKQFVGNASTYTWKNHLQWYQQRKAQAVIWLVRRATRALEYESRLLEAQRYLLVIRQKAFAISYLMEVGHASLSAKDGRLDAKRRLLKKVIHARKQLLKVKEAREFLLFSAKGALKDCAYMDRVYALKNPDLAAMRANDGKFDASLLPPKKKGPDYGNLFKVRNLQSLASRYLREQAQIAAKHCARQDEALYHIRDVVRKIQIQFVMKDRARRDLVLRAEAAYQFCIQQDQALLLLLRVGGAAVKHIARREAASEWLVQRAQEGVTFLAKQSELSAYLFNYGRRILKYMNARENAFAYLNTRRMKSISFIGRKKEAEVFLRKCPQGLWAVYDRMNEAQDWLATRAKRALDYYNVRIKAAQYLQFIASKAGATHRKSYLAQQELMQLGLLARIQYFKVAHKNHDTLVKLVKDEKKIIRKNDIRREKQRKLWSFGVRLKVELAETIEIIHSIYTPIHLLLKTPMQRLEYLNPAAKQASPSKALSPSRPSTAQGSQPLAITDRPGTAPVPSRPLQLTNFNTDAASSTALVAAGAPSSQALTTTSGRRFGSPSKRNLDAPVEEVSIDRATAQQFLIGKFAFRKLTNNGKVLHTDRTMIDEFFRNHDLNSSCYITMFDVYPWFHKRASKIKNFQFRVSDVLSVEERALIHVFKRYLTDKDLLEAPVKKRKKRSDQDEEISKYGGRLGQTRQYVDSDEEEEDDDGDDIDEDLLFSDLELLKNADIGRLMRYLTKKKEDELLQAAEAEKQKDASVKQLTSGEEGDAAAGEPGAEPVNVEGGDANPDAAVVEEPAPQEPPIAAEEAATA